MLEPPPREVAPSVLEPLPREVAPSPSVLEPPLREVGWRCRGPLLRAVVLAPRLSRVMAAVALLELPSSNLSWSAPRLLLCCLVVGRAEALALPETPLP